MIRFPFLETLGVKIALMTDRHDGDFADEDDSLLRLCERLELNCERVATIKQVHGTDIHDVESIPKSGEGDGLITLNQRRPIAIRIADCVPVFLVDTQKHAAALLHAGWRGTLEGIAQGGVEMLCEKYGCQPNNIHAVVGPSAGPERLAKKR